MKEIVNLTNIYKSFGAVQALIDFNVSINEGEIVGLMGDNGAGKSTLLKILAGNFLPTSGKINFNGEDVIFNNPNDARRAGVEVVYPVQSNAVFVRFPDKVVEALYNYGFNFGCWGKKSEKIYRIMISFNTPIESVIDLVNAIREVK